MSDLKTMSDVREAHKACGRFFFSRDTMRHWKSRVESQLYTGPGGQYFVTSEQFEDHGPRKFSVRSVKDSGCTIRTVGDFHTMLHKDDARDAAKKLAKGK